MRVPKVSKGSIGSKSARKPEVSEEEVDEDVAQMLAEANEFDDQDDQDFSVESGEEAEDAAEGDDVSSQQEEDEREQEDRGSLVKVDAVLLGQLARGVATQSPKVAVRVARVFADLFNHENQGSSKARYTADDLDILKGVYNLFFQELAQAVHGHLARPEWLAARRSFAKQTLQFLRQTKDESVLQKAMASVSHQIEVFLAFPTFLKKLTASLLSVWGSSDQAGTKYAVFMLLWRLFEVAPDQFKLKLSKAWLAKYCNASARLSWYNYDHFVFMRNCMATLFDSNPQIAYLALYEQLKQLSQQVVETSKKKSLDNAKLLYSFRTIAFLQLVGQILQQRRHLIELAHPFVEVTLGLLDLFPSQTYIPLHLHLLDLLSTYSLASGTFTPLFRFVERTLQNKHFVAKLPSKKTKFDLEVSCRVTEEQLKEGGIWEGFLETLLTVTTRYLLWAAKTPAFLEFSFVVLKSLKKLFKRKQPSHFRERIRKMILMLIADRKKVRESGADSQAELELQKELGSFENRRRKIVKANVAAHKAQAQKKKAEAD